MDIKSLRKIVVEAEISGGLKDQILEMIDAEGVYSEELVQKIQKLLDGTTEDILNQIADIQIQDATEEFNEQTKALEEKIDDFGKEVNKKIGEIDLADVQSNLGIK